MYHYGKFYTLDNHQLMKGEGVYRDEKVSMADFEDGLPLIEWASIVIGKFYGHKELWNSLWLQRACDLMNQEEK